MSTPQTLTKEPGKAAPQREIEPKELPTVAPLQETAKAEPTPVAPPAHREAAHVPGSVETSGVEGKAPARPGFGRLIMTLVIAALVIGGAAWGYRAWTFGQVHTSTDDAQLTNDVVQIAPQVSGTVSKVLVKENQEVKVGDLIAVLDDATYRASYDQAKANLDLAVAAAQQAGVSVQLTSETGNAQVLQAQGVVSQAESGIAGARADVSRAEAGVSNANAAARGADANVLTMQANLDAAIASKKKAQDAIASAQAQVDTAQAAVSAAQASVGAAQAVYDRASHDEQRYSTLIAEGAVSEQTYDQAVAASRQAKAQLENANQQVAQAKATVAQRQADLNAAKQQVEWSDAGIAQARAQVAASREQVKAAQSGVHQAEAQRTFAQQGVKQAIARRDQAAGQLSQAQTAPRQVAVSQGAESQAKAKIEQAKAALEAAKIQLDDTRIYAPVSGRVSRKTVEEGALVQPGTTLLSIVPTQNPWVIANFKETQLAHVRSGQPAEVEVDGIPSHNFKGHVESISAGTGATFALLPPDNATGNFTKVVQRIPVKITIEPDQPDMDRLRAGMSVTATISTK